MKLKKAISPLIATILLIVVAVILVTVVLTWSKGFFSSSLDDGADVTDFTKMSASDASMYFYRPSLEGDLLRFTYSPPSGLSSQTIVIDRYSVVGYSGGPLSLSPSVTLQAGMGGISGVDISSLNVTDSRIDLVLITDDDKIINLRNTSYTIPDGPPVLLPYVMYGNSKLYLHPTDAESKMNWDDAIAYCSDMNSEVGYGYDDWYLPSTSQLASIWLACSDVDKSTVCMNAAIAATDQTEAWVGFTSNWYWSSTEYSASTAYTFYMSSGSISGYSKTIMYECVVFATRSHSF